MKLDISLVPDPDTVWLFHGTTADGAKGFMRDGWNPPDPYEQVRALAQANGVSPELLLDQYTAQGALRTAAGEMSCTTGWRLAAAYARNGAEFLHFARCALERLKRGDDFQGNPPAFDANVAILLFRVPWAKVTELTVDEAAVLPRTKFLPDGVGWPTLGLFQQLDRAPIEVVVTGPRLRAYLVGLDIVRPECDCSGSSMLGKDAPQDTRLRCEVCFVSSSDATATLPS